MVDFPVPLSPDITGPSEKAQVNLEDDGGYTNTGLHPTVGKKRAEDGSLVVMYPSSNEKGVTLRFAQVKPDGKGGLAAAKGWSTTIEASGYPYVTDSAAGLFPDGEGGHEVFVVAYYTAGGDPSGKKRPECAQHGRADDAGSNQDTIGFFNPLKTITGVYYEKTAYRNYRQLPL